MFFVGVNVLVVTRRNEGGTEQRFSAQISLPFSAYFMKE